MSGLIVAKPQVKQNYLAALNSDRKPLFEFCETKVGARRLNHIVTNVN